MLSMTRPWVQSPTLYKNKTKNQTVLSCLLHAEEEWLLESENVLGDNETLKQNKTQAWRHTVILALLV